MTTQYARPASTSPVFDSLVAELRPAAPRPSAPVVETRRTVRADTAPIWMQAKAAEAARRAASAQAEIPTAAPVAQSAPVAPSWMSSPTAPASPTSLFSEPLTSQQLTNAERELVAEMGGTVARLLLQMMHDERPDALRR